LGSAIWITYTWKTGPAFKPLAEGYKAFVHFLDSHDAVLFGDDHVPTPSPNSWQAGQTYSYTRLLLIPIYPYVGNVKVVMGLYPMVGRGERVPLKGEDVGMRAYKVADMEFLPQTENIFLVYKEGWHSPEASPQNPSLERTWTKREGLVSFKNPKQDVMLYLEADTNFKAFPKPPVLTVSVAGKRGVVIPIENSELLLKKIKFTKEDLGNDEWVDLRLTMNQSFVPKALGINDRELGLLVYHLYLGEVDKLGKIPEDGIMVAGPVTLPSPPPAPAAGTKAAPVAPKPAPAAKK